MSARFHHSGRKKPISAPSTVNSSQKIFLSIRPEETLPLMNTDDTDEDRIIGSSGNLKTLQLGEKEEQDLPRINADHADQNQKGEV